MGTLWIRFREQVWRWTASAARPTFARTVCACHDCSRFCKTKPGALIPSDVPRIAARLVELKLIDREANVSEFLRATHPTTVFDRDLGKHIQIKKIGPARNQKGRCVFLDEADRCRIHSVSPFGCAYFDAHMPKAEAERRWIWGLTQIRSSAEYQSLRETLRLAEGGKNE